SRRGDRELRLRHQVALASVTLSARNLRGSSTTLGSLVAAITVRTVAVGGCAVCAAAATLQAPSKEPRTLLLRNAFRPPNTWETIALLHTPWQDVISHRI